MTQPEQTPPIDVTAPVVSAIGRQLGDDSGLAPEQIAAVLSTWNNIIQGDPPGTIRRDAMSGAVGHRIIKDGVHQWHISAADGGTAYDMQPTLPGWTAVFTPESTTVEPSGP